jgi:hypothetical protein
VLGRIPQNRLYQPGLAILNWWPQPNIANVPAGQAYNYEVTDPSINLLGYQPIIRLDYQPQSNLRANFKFLEYQQPNDPIPGILAGFNDTREDDYGIWVPAGSINWTVNPTTFFEAAVGANFHHQEGCSVTGGSPNFCRNGLPVNASANRNTAGFGAIPYLFPDATILEPGTFPMTWCRAAIRRSGMEAACTGHLRSPGAIASPTRRRISRARSATSSSTRACTISTPA